MSAVPLETAVPQGQFKPFATVTPNDHTAWILVVTAMGIAFTAMSLLTRVLIRSFINRGWGWDDTTTVIATLLSWIQFALVLAASADGLGKSLDLIPASLQGRIEGLYYASNLLYICTLDLSKVSIIFFIKRLLAAGTPQMRYCQGLLVLVPVSTVAFFFAAALQCNLSQPWAIFDGQCSATGWFLKWEIHGAFSMFTEVAIFVCPIWLVAQLQTSKELKAEVISSFAPRLLIIIFTALRLASFNSASFTKNTTLVEAPYVCWTEAELTYAMMAATIPTARKLMLNFITYYNQGGFSSNMSNGGGIYGGSRTVHTGPANSGSQAEAYHMDVLKSAGNRKKAVGYTGAVDRGDPNDDASSQEMIIRKQTTVEIIDNRDGYS